MPILDVVLILLFLLITLAVGLRISSGDTSDTGYLLGGRALTLPAFVATTVSTWYGGILGVGEYGWMYGISNWLVFGVPYYVMALLFALLLSRRARRGESVTLPHRLGEFYGRKAGRFSGILVFLTSMPAAYMLIMGTLLSMTFGLPQNAGILITAAFITVYLWRGGFSAVTRTDFFQCLLMFGGFIMLTGFLVSQNGLEPLRALPPSHWSPTGGLPVSEVLIWYFIAMSTLAEPNFFQRAFAAKTPEIARCGMFISIACWICFDAMTTFCALYSRALLPDLEQPVMAFPLLAIKVLPTGFLGLFFIGMLATVLSTLDSNMFTVATTFGRDLWPTDGPDKPNDTRTRTRIGLLVAASLSAALALMSQSVVQLWKIFGSVSTAALLIPILSTYYPRLRMSSRGALVLMISSSAVTIAWFAAEKLFGHAPFGLPPLFAGAFVAVAVFAFDIKFNSKKS